MTPEECKRQCDLLVAKSEEVGRKQAILAQRYDGNMLLYRAACAENNTSEMENIRQALLTMVGDMLDNIALQSMLGRQVTDILAEANRSAN